MPRIWLPLSLFLAGTLVSLAFSGDIPPGCPQIRKFYVFRRTAGGLLPSAQMPHDPLARSSLGPGIGAHHRHPRLRAVRAESPAGAPGSAADSYDSYVGERITGFISHWNTFSAAGDVRPPHARRVAVLRRPAESGASGSGSAARVLIAFAIVLGETRAIWVGTAVAGALPVSGSGAVGWSCRVPVVAILRLRASLPVPRSRERFTSFFSPKEAVDSNQFRIVTWRTGLRMIE